MINCFNFNASIKQKVVEKFLFTRNILHQKNGQLTPTERSDLLICSELIELLSTWDNIKDVSFEEFYHKCLDFSEIFMNYCNGKYYSHDGYFNFSDIQNMFDSLSKVSEDLFHKYLDNKEINFNK